MRLRIDECLPRALKRPLQEHTCRTVQEMGWSGKKNGELLSLAETEFDALLTMDQGFEHQQNLSKAQNRDTLAGREIESNRRFGANCSCHSQDSRRHWPRSGSPHRELNQRA